MNTGGAHGSPTVLPLLKPMPIEQNTSNKSMSDLIEERAVDATLGTSLPEAIRSNPDIVRLFPNYVELEKEFYKRTKIYPIMHLVAIRKQVYEKYPFIATSLYDAFCKSKKIALEKMFNLRALRYMTPFLMRDIDEIYEVFDGDPWPYGLEPNRPTLEAFVTYLTDQSLIAAPVPVDDLFVPTYERQRSPAVLTEDHVTSGQPDHEQSRHRHPRPRHRQPHPRARGRGGRLRPCQHPPSRQSEALFPRRARSRPNWSSATTSSNWASTGSRCATRSARSISSASFMPPSSKRGPTSIRSCMPTPRTSCRSASRRRRRCGR